MTIIGVSLDLFSSIRAGRTVSVHPLALLLLRLKNRASPRSSTKGTCVDNNYFEKNTVDVKA